jgi:DNA-binding Lrp family transcriptional regulator
MSVDATDVRLVRELGLQPFLNWPRHPDDLKPASLAKRLGLGVDAVKERLRRLEREGILQGFEIFPNFRHFGLQVSSVRFRLADEGARARAMTEVQAVDGVQAVTGFLGTELCVDLCHRNPTEMTRRAGVLSRLMGDATYLGACDYPLPPVDHELSPFDWRILQALRGQPRRRLEDVAESLGVSARTVKRRFERMAKAGDFDIVANVDPGALRNSIMAFLLVHLRPDATKAEGEAVVASLPERWFHVWMPGHKPDFFAAVVAASMGELEELRRQTESLPGVVMVESRIPVDMHTDMRWIDEWIRERAKSIEPKARIAAAGRAPKPAALQSSPGPRLRSG